jgi:hypothetical protein
LFIKRNYKKCPHISRNKKQRKGGALNRYTIAADSIKRSV